MTKADLRKVYGPLNWEFILKILQVIGMPDSTVSKIKNCIRPPSFFVSINGSLEGFFAVNKGVRGGSNVPLPICVGYGSLI